MCCQALFREKDKPNPSFDAIRCVFGHRHRVTALSGTNESRGMPSSAGDGFAVSFWSSGQDSGCAGITETRETGLFRAMRERGHEVARGRKARQIAPKTRNSAFLENTTGSKKPTSKISKRYSLGVYALWRAEGLPLTGRVSAAVRVFYFPAV